MKSIYFCLFSFFLFVCYVNSESSNNIVLNWTLPVNYILRNELSVEAEETVNKTLIKIQNETCLNFTQIPEQSSDTNMRDVPSRSGIAFSVNRDNEETGACPNLNFGGDDVSPYTEIELDFDNQQNITSAESCIYKALGINDSKKINCTQNKVQITIDT